MSRQRVPLDGHRLDQDFGGHERGEHHGTAPEVNGYRQDAYGHAPSPYAHPRPHPGQTFDADNYAGQPGAQPHVDPHESGGYAHAQQPHYPAQSHPQAFSGPAGEPRVHYPEHVPADLSGTSYVYPEDGVYAQAAAPATPELMSSHPAPTHWPPVEAPAQSSSFGDPRIGDAAAPLSPADHYPSQSTHALDRTPVQQAPTHPVGGVDGPFAQPPLRGGTYDDQYDLGAYAPRGGETSAPAPFGAPDHDPFAAPAATPHAAPPQHYGADGADPSQVYGFDPYAPVGTGGAGVVAPQVHDEHYDDEYEYEDEDEDDTRGGRSRLMVGIAAVLVGSVAIGGGLAFGYKQFFTGDEQTSSSPVILSGQQQTRQAPSDAGGQRFANTNSKLLDRLDNGRGVGGTSSDRRPQQSPNERTRAAAERVRTVSTHIVRPDGTLVESTPAARPDAGAQRPSPTAPTVSSPIPGMTLVGVTPTTPTQPRRVETPVAPVARVAPVTPRTAPIQAATSTPSVVIANATPVTRGGGVTQPATTPQQASAPGASSIPLPVRNTFPREQRAAPVVRQASVGSQTRRPPVAAPSGVSSAAGGTSPGFVAVLASKPNRMDALAAFADLRSRYSNVLSTSIPEVQQADLSARGLGTMYRVVVGPPGSRAAANGLCTKLGAVGYSDCWVKQY